MPRSLRGRLRLGIQCIAFLLLFSAGAFLLSGLAFWLFPTCVMVGFVIGTILMAKKILLPRYSDENEGKVETRRQRKVEQTYMEKVRNSVAIAGPLVFVVGFITSHGNQSGQYGLLVCGSIIALFAGWLLSYALRLYLTIKSEEQAG